MKTCVLSLVSVCLLSASCFAQTAWLSGYKYEEDGNFPKISVTVQVKDNTNRDNIETQVKAYNGMNLVWTSAIQSNTALTFHETISHDVLTDTLTKFIVYVDNDDTSTNLLTQTVNLSLGSAGAALIDFGSDGNPEASAAGDLDRINYSYYWIEPGTVNDDYTIYLQYRNIYGSWVDASDYQLGGEDTIYDVSEAEAFRAGRWGYIDRVDEYTSGWHELRLQMRDSSDNVVDSSFSVMIPDSTQQ